LPPAATSAAEHLGREHWPATASRNQRQASAASSREQQQQTERLQCITKPMSCRCPAGPYTGKQLWNMALGNCTKEIRHLAVAAVAAMAAETQA